jgi:flagellar biosynthetic protein FlhB
MQQLCRFGRRGFGAQIIMLVLLSLVVLPLPHFMMEAVPKADVVVMNPSHFAVALKYGDDMRAPRVIAKGLDLVAQRIRGVAGKYDVPLVTVPPLARALYHTTRVGQEIPAALYVAVAQILAYVYRVRDAAAQAGDVPPPPNPDIDPQLLGPYQLPDGKH